MSSNTPEDGPFCSPDEKGNFAEIPTQVDEPGVDDDEDDEVMTFDMDELQTEFEEQDEDDDSSVEEIVKHKHLEVDGDGNGFDDIGHLIKQLNGKDIKEKNNVVTMITNMLYVIATDAVYKTSTTKEFDKNVRLANEMDNLVANIHSMTSLFYYERFIARLDGKDLPKAVIKKHRTLIKEKPGKTFMGKYKNKIGTKTDEEFILSAYGYKIYTLAVKTKRVINSRMIPYWRDLESGNTEGGLLLAIRKTVHPFFMKEKAITSATNKTAAAKRSTKSGKGKKLKLDIEETTSSAALSVKTEKLEEEVTCKFESEWFPVEWLAFLVLSLPAKERGLPYLVPSTSVPQVVQPTSFKKRINNIKEESSDSLKGKATPSKSFTPAKTEYTMTHVFRTEESAGEKRKVRDPLHLQKELIGVYASLKKPELQRAAEEDYARMLCEAIQNATKK
jgi:hypothetical protein